MLGTLRRLLPRRPSYKRVSSGSQSTPDVHDDDDLYNTDEEVTHGGFVWCAFLMLGMSIMTVLIQGWPCFFVLPPEFTNSAWFSFTTAAAFFREVFSSKPALVKSSTSAIAAASTVPNLAVMFTLARERTETKINRRIILGLSMNLGLFTIFSILILAVPHPSPIPYYIFTLFSVMLGSTATALIQYAAFGLAGRFGPLYTQAI